MRATSRIPCEVRCGWEAIRARTIRLYGRVSTRLRKPSTGHSGAGASGTKASQITSRQYPNCSRAGRTATSHTAMPSIFAPAGAFRER